MDGEGVLNFIATPPQVGEPAPFFTAATDSNDRYSLEVAAGRWIVLMAFGTLAEPAAARAFTEVVARRALFNDRDAAFFGVSVDPADRLQRGLANSEPGLRFFWDFDCRVSRLYGVADAQHLRPSLFLIDPAFRIAMAEPIESAGAVLDRLEAALKAAPGEAETQVAPVLTLPRILEPEVCAALIACYRAGDPSASGFAKDVDGYTIQQVDPFLKRRTDVTIEDEALIEDLRLRLETRLFPMVKRAFGWQAKHIERYLICRYGAEDRGFFSRHRDDVTAGSAHRKFAVSINLNEDFEGGDLRFPEFGPRTYRPPMGGATVFGCNLLHEATPVTRGERFVYVPFLYDAEGARIRRANLARVAIGAQENRHMRRARAVERPKPAGLRASAPGSGSSDGLPPAPQDRA
ncbi:redoxin domain-containing protein [Phenylobacterium sp.]|uniref:redoxin domain-containing protein n=1 Tax=Phenylobacterium sp. TaxID=1871053 RepID=UPI002E334438|nr:redoxin domain-containing protein [Phenylobacterium sp.]HEX4711048.1 redoxin domain-containing protein [Phenylobacterium sp.]